jgi:hypothetical protein
VAVALLCGRGTPRVHSRVAVALSGYRAECLPQSELRRTHDYVVAIVSSADLSRPSCTALESGCP